MVLQDIKVKGLGRQTEMPKNLEKNLKKSQLDMKLETVTTGGKAQGRGRRIIVGLQNYVFAYRLDGEGNGTSLQYSCLENPMDGGAW